MSKAPPVCRNTVQDTLQVNSCTWCAGIIAYAPARTVDGLAPFIPNVPTPVAIRTSSADECQCHGIRQPLAAFSVIIDAPLEGSPLNTEPLTHVGVSGKDSNFCSPRLLTIGSAEAEGTSAAREGYATTSASTADDCAIVPIDMT